MNVTAIRFHNFSLPRCLTVWEIALLDLDAWLVGNPVLFGIGVVTDIEYGAHLLHSNQCILFAVDITPVMNNEDFEVLGFLSLHFLLLSLCPAKFYKIVLLTPCHLVEDKQQV